MGYMRHHAIIVTSENVDLIRAVHGAGSFLFPKTTTPVVGPVVNGYYSFMVGPDGSKEGWSESTEGNEKRKDFIKFPNSFKFSDGSTALKWAEVQFGDDDGDNRILRTDQDEEDQPETKEENHGDS